MQSDSKLADWPRLFMHRLNVDIAKIDIDETGEADLTEDDAYLAFEEIDDYFDIGIVSTAKEIFDITLEFGENMVL